MSVEPEWPATGGGVEARRQAEPFRPAYHYTAQKNMINDPNGLVYLGGVYHLFHQYNQHEAIHWGHATSADLVHWKHVAPAIYPDGEGQVYSGGMAVDHHNVSGLAPAGATVPVLLAFFTSAAHQDGTQSQSVAYSTDSGETWCRYPGNPVLPNPGLRDFRDPAVLWHEPSLSWVMVLAAGDHVDFYRSNNLLDWRAASSWGRHHGSHGGVWECPDLFELPVDGTGRRAWVLSVSVGDGGPAGGSGMQYFVGDFDGTEFSTDQPEHLVLWQNWGKDYYAGITWRNLPSAQGRTVMIAWADNWQYRFDIPTAPFNGQLTVPRELGLIQTRDGLRLTCVPVRELDALRGEPLMRGPLTVDPSASHEFASVGDSYEVVVELDLAATTATAFVVGLRVGEGEHTQVGVRLDTAQIFIDRTASGENPHAEFAGRHDAPLDIAGRLLNLRILVDRSSVEVFAGHVVQLADLILPSASSRGLTLSAEGGQVVLQDFTIFPMADVWPTGWTQISSTESGEWAETTIGIQGSAAATGRARIGGPGPLRSCSMAIEVVGSRDGNPRPILGEAGAGVLLRAASGPSDDVIIELAVDVQALVVRGAGTETGRAEFRLPLETNHPYDLRLELNARTLTVCVNEKLVAALADRDPFNLELHVRNAEAIFSDINCAE